MPLRTLLLMAVAVLFLYLLFTVGAPFLLALIAAIALEPLTLFLIRKVKVNRLIASTVSSSVLTLGLLGLLALIGMKLVSELGNYFNRLPSFIHSANGYIQNWIENLQAAYSHKGDAPVPNQLENWLSKLTDALTQLSTNISKYLLGFAASVPDFFIFLIVFLVAVYLFTLSLPMMKSSFLSLFEEKSHAQVEQVLVSLRKSVFGFFRAQLLLSAITYVVSFAGLLFIGTGYPLAIALLIVGVDILPVLGTGSVLIPWAIYRLILGDMYTGIGLICLFLVIAIIRRIVEPKILGDAVGIGALSALISLYVGYELVGIIGLFLGPVTVIVFMAMRKAGLFDFKIKF
jgi:sporulation integral membrane protein YtvI